jgi:hypothetical protein
LIENNRNLIFLLKLMDIRGDVVGARILPEAGNEDGDEKYFSWWGKEW